MRVYSPRHTSPRSPTRIIAARRAVSLVAKPMSFMLLGIFWSMGCVYYGSHYSFGVPSHQVPNFFPMEMNSRMHRGIHFNGTANFSPTDPVQTNLDGECTSHSTYPNCQALGNVTTGSHHRLAFLIPFRDLEDPRSQGAGRTQNLKHWIAYMHDFLPHEILQSSEVFVIEQTSSGVFNKGLMFNAGFQLVNKMGVFDYYVLHDVDQVPMRDQDGFFLYGYRSKPAKLIKATTRKASPNATEQARPLNSGNVGGALMITGEDYKKTNGYSNQFGGWGGEDDNMARRLKRHKDVGYDVLPGMFRELYHERVWGLDNNQQFENNVANRDEYLSGINDANYTLMNHTKFLYKGWAIHRAVVMPATEPHAHEGRKPLHDKRTPQRVSGAHSTIPGNKCDGLFGFESIVPMPEATWCYHHIHLKWVSCRLGTVVVHPHLIIGSTGGENMDEVAGRNEQLEYLGYLRGAFEVADPGHVYPTSAKPSAHRKTKELLDSFVPQSLHAPTDTKTDVLNGPTLLLKRGDYANPCMTMASLYNAFVVQHSFNLSLPRIVWLDGHASGSLDSIWSDLFPTGAIHVKQLKNGTTLEDAILVNTLSAFGDEGVRKHAWGEACSQGSSLHQFRDYVLSKYGLARSKANNGMLTMLVRKDHKAHPRSSGIVDRKLANIEKDRKYIQTLYPSHRVSVFSFEDMSFQQQLKIIVQTDVFVAVHGAGNIHSIFLPDHAVFEEYFPPKFQARQRFRYLSESLNITYVKKTAQYVSGNPGQILVQLSPPSFLRDTPNHAIQGKNKTVDSIPSSQGHP